MADFHATFDRLRALMLRHGDGLTIARDTPGGLEVRTKVLDAKGQPGWFGTVTVKKSYVAYHLIPLYADPGLADGLSDALTERRQGKTCFNFKAPDDALFAELDALTERARKSL